MKRVFHLALAAGLASALGCSRPPRSIQHPPAVEQLDGNSVEQSAMGLLQDVTRAAESAGAQPPVVLAYGAGIPGDRIESMVVVPTDACALFVARATETVEDLDLHVYGDDGSQYGIDESPDDLPTLLLCPNEDARLFASARVAQGEGLVALGVQTVAKSDAPKVARAVGARNFSGEIAPLEDAWPGLEEALEVRRASLGGRFLDQRRVALPLDSRVPTHLTIEVPAERCIDTLILPSPDVSGVQLTALDGDGRIFARGESQGTQRTLLLCSRAEGRSITLRLRPYSGRGVAVAAISSSRGPLATLEPPAEVGVALVDQAQPPEDRSKLAPPRSTTQLRLTRGHLSSQEFKLQGCTRLDFVPDDSLLDFEARLYDDRGKLLAETTGRSASPIFACRDGLGRLDVEAKGRSGALSVEVRSAPPSSPLLLEFPLAASRLLVRAHSVGRLSLPEEVGRVEKLHLDATSLSRVPLSIPAAHCQTLVFGSDHGAWGVQARIVDPKLGLTLDQAIGRGSLEVHACAPKGGHLNAIVEIQTTSGETTALFSVRQERLPPD